MPHQITNCPCTSNPNSHSPPHPHPTRIHDNSHSPPQASPPRSSDTPPIPSGRDWPRVNPPWTPRKHPYYPSGRHPRTQLHRRHHRRHCRILPGRPPADRQRDSTSPRQSHNYQNWANTKGNSWDDPDPSRIRGECDAHPPSTRDAVRHVHRLRLCTVVVRTGHSNRSRHGKIRDRMHPPSW